MLGNQWRILIRWSEEQVVAQVREWHPENAAMTEPRFWQDVAYKNLSQPVVGVCWYEGDGLRQLAGKRHRSALPPAHRTRMGVGSLARRAALPVGS